MAAIGAGKNRSEQLHRHSSKQFRKLYTCLSRRGAIDPGTEATNSGLSDTGWMNPRNGQIWKTSGHAAEERAGIQRRRIVLPLYARKLERFVIARDR